MRVSRVLLSEVVMFAPQFEFVSKSAFQNSTEIREIYRSCVPQILVVTTHFDVVLVHIPHLSFLGKGDPTSVVSGIILSQCHDHFFQPAHNRLCTGVGFQILQYFVVVEQVGEQHGGCAQPGRAQPQVIDDLNLEALPEALHGSRTAVADMEKLQQAAQAFLACDRHFLACDRRYRRRFGSKSYLMYIHLIEIQI
jgi:hypothetical protein